MSACRAPDSTVPISRAKKRVMFMEKTGGISRATMARPTASPWTNREGTKARAAERQANTSSTSSSFPAGRPLAISFHPEKCPLVEAVKVIMLLWVPSDLSRRVTASFSVTSPNSW